jgi:flagella basal body P-ring formation protein FlgA
MKLRFMVSSALAACVALAFDATCVRAQGTQSAQSAVSVAVPAAAREIARGVELTAADIAGDAALRTGWISRRVIHEGEPLKEPAVVPPQLVRAGTEITVRAETGGVVVTRTGTALMSGSLGDRIRVRIDSQHVVTGIVAASATVKIQ